LLSPWYGRTEGSPRHDPGGSARAVGAQRRWIFSFQPAAGAQVLPGERRELQQSPGGVDHGGVEEPPRSAGGTERGDGGGAGGHDAARDAVLGHPELHLLQRDVSSGTLSSGERSGGEGRRRRSKAEFLQLFQNVGVYHNGSSFPVLCNEIIWDFFSFPAPSYLSYLFFSLLFFILRRP